MYTFALCLLAIGFIHLFSIFMTNETPERLEIYIFPSRNEECSSELNSSQAQAGDKTKMSKYSCIIQWKNDISILK